MLVNTSRREVVDHDAVQRSLDEELIVSSVDPTATSTVAASNSSQNRLTDGCRSAGSGLVARRRMFASSGEPRSPSRQSSPARSLSAQMAKRPS
ncbi:hypothetical protein predicted by Glimmer/Critica [Sorangium cellulosum So ce56]|uniref:Uncharacterized protein n=1 Tax=Sorangium cellulosum (strain So ce56) TaxID=448385 RepID=A9GU05_SORC5|nr:hypothetical protein predicted by Glimmer/Critica [Sorangium cellulosum So ce56]